MDPWDGLGVWKGFGDSLVRPEEGVEAGPARDEGDDEPPKPVFLDDDAPPFVASSVP